MKTVLIFAILIFLSFNVRSQNAPSAAEPETGNRILIDSLMIISKYDEYFINYCDREIDNAAKINQWTFEQTRMRKLNVNFADFKKYTIYNWFSRLSKTELTELISLLGKINVKDKYSGFFITHSGVQSNLELFVKEYIK